MQIPTQIDTPIATDSVTNKPSSQKASLYHTCRAVLNGLASVPGFDYYLTMEPTTTITSEPSTSTSLLSPVSPSFNNTTTTTTTTVVIGDPAAPPLTPTTPTTLKTTNINTNTNKINDPLSKLWFICRQGASLCLLFNTLKPESAIDISQKMKSKAYVYHFSIACRDHLGLDQENLFTVSDLFQDDTNGFVKVVNTVRKILELLEINGIISIKKHLHRRHSSTNTPKDTRSKVVIELLETERKYVQDLESLQYYMREAHAQKVLAPDTLHQLFGNLNALLDFQRRFLIHAEDNADRPPQEQRFGSLFVQLEDAFSVYEPFCANFQTAQTLVIQESNKLQKLADIMSPSYELPSMLIKPVQRVCKYPLILKELVKSTPEDWTYYHEMKMGLEAIQRVTSKVNETKRRQENMVYVEDLLSRILDQSWKGAIPSYGCLLLHERFVLYRNDVDYQVLMYLFEKSVFICTDEKDTTGHQANNHHHNGKKSISSVTKKKKSLSNSSNNNKENNGGGLNVKGRIFISQLVQVTDVSQAGLWSLRIYWSERDPKPHSIQSFNLKSFILKCRNGEQLRQWEAAFSKLIQNEKRLSRESRAAAEASVSKHQQQSSSTTNFVSTTATSIQQQQQQQTLKSRSLSGMKYGEGRKVLDSDIEDDEEEDDENDDVYDELMHSSDEEDSEFYGHSQNNTNHVQQQQHQRHSHSKSQNSVSLGSNYYGHNNNNETNNNNNNTISTSNQHPTMPGMTLPPLPRDSGIDTTTNSGSYSPPNSYPSSPLTNSYPSSPSASTRASTSSSSGSSTMWQQSQQRRYDASEMIGRSILNSSEVIGIPPTSSTDDDSYPFLPSNNNNTTSNTTRMRSQSSPNIHQQIPFEDTKDVPLPINSRTLYYHQQQQQQQQRDRLSAGYPYEQQEQNEDYNSILVPPSTIPPVANVKIKLNYMDDIYVIVVPLDITFDELLDRIDRKIRVYMGDMDILVGLKYQDEDGDLITISSTEDVQMGFESRGVSNTVNFFAVMTTTQMMKPTSCSTTNTTTPTTTPPTLINGCTR
ncbi:hypothetical protein INT45_006535 [Circinella minor]|uniref:DH domain-containing protein n=1 Tax=Circinella minor TaxID=1195481 RepID=A0A8H7RRH8_9FUNG|nr:hypothetical protein INT45_006535 [Circinella minor]